MSETELSVVILCYRAEEAIIPFIQQIHKELSEINVNFELVLVANYDKDSTDVTPQIVKKHAKDFPNYRVISEIKEGRMGWDMRTGLSAAKGKYIAVIDGDAQMPSSDIVLVYHIIKTGRYDLVKTFRAKRFDGFYRKYMSLFYNFLFNLLFQPKIKVRDINSKPKIITREALDQLTLASSDWFTDAEIMIEAFKLQLRVCDISTIFYKNERRKSFVKVGTAFEFTYNLFYYRFFKK